MHKKKINIIIALFFIFLILSTQVNNVYAVDNCVHEIENYDDVDLFMKNEIKNKIVETEKILNTLLKGDKIDEIYEHHILPVKETIYFCPNCGSSLGLWTVEHTSYMTCYQHINCVIVAFYITEIIMCNNGFCQVIISSQTKLVSSYHQPIMK